MPATPFKVKAVYEYNSAEPDDLNFPNGQIITVTAEEDDDWYSGEYVNTAGEKVDGIFPRNFVEKYEPAVPSRPTRTPKKQAQPEAQEIDQGPAPGLATSAVDERPAEPISTAKAEPPAPALEAVPEPQKRSPPLQTPDPASSVPRSPPVTTASKPASSRAPPPVAEKPSGNSFRDRIAAFNKTAAPPVAPFKPGAQGGSSSGFIKKPFVAPPPSKSAYVPPPREQQPQTIYRREEEAETSRDAPAADSSEPSRATIEPAGDEDQPKAMSLKERIALIQKHQEDDNRRAEAPQKKEKPKKPVKKRTESSEDVIHPPDTSEATLDRVDTNETVGKKSVDFADDEAGPLRGPRRQPSGHAQIRTPPPPSRELMSDTNDADDSGAGDTEDAMGTSTEEDRTEMRRIHASTDSRSKEVEAPAGEVEEEADTEKPDEEEEEEEEDPEVKRKRELRERMAKLSGGMGAGNVFGMPSGFSGPRKSRTQAEGERQPSNKYEQEDLMARAPPVQIMALPGMSNMRPSRPEPAVEVDSDDEDTAQHTPQESETKDLSEDEEDEPLPPRRISTDRAAPPVPRDRAVPPPPPREARAAPPPPPSERAAPPVPQAAQARAVPPPPPIATGPLSPVGKPESDLSSPPPVPSGRPQSKDGPQSPPGAPPVPSSRPSTDSAYRTTSPPSSPTVGEKRVSRAPPPMPPMSPAVVSSQTRAPPPPPPGQPPSRRSTTNSHHSMASSKHHVDNDSEDEVTEYDGDYDTDIASSAKHKDALKSHNRDSSLDDEALGDEILPSSPLVRAVPPLPSSAAPRDLPPPLPPSVPKSRTSLDAPRAAPPPVPPPKEAYGDYIDEYDPYRYQPPQQGSIMAASRPGYAPQLQSPKEELDEGDMYEATPQATRAVPPPADSRGVPIMPTYASLPVPMGEPPRESSEVKRSGTLSRRSMEQGRPSSEHGFIATDIDLGQNSMWWTQDKLPPPSLQNRSDVRYEIESSTSTKRGGKTTISKDIYVLYMDYSQSTINAMFDPQEPSHAILEQRHDRPPPPLRQDQLEEASKQYSARIAEAAAAKSNTTVGDGSAHAFVYELIQAMSGALLPVGTRAYGALVYANLANASTQQFDEIRPGDIVTFRNAKFSGHKGGFNSKYGMDVGKPDHAGVVLDWDGTKKKIRAWDQGREADGKGSKKGKVKEESFRVGDLKSGEVRVWRVMGRRWVGWDK